MGRKETYRERERERERKRERKRKKKDCSNNKEGYKIKYYGVIIHVIIRLLPVVAHKGRLFHKTNS